VGPVARGRGERTDGEAEADEGREEDVASGEGPMLVERLCVAVGFGVGVGVKVDFELGVAYGGGGRESKYPRGLESSGPAERGGSAGGTGAVVAEEDGLLANDFCVGVC
jgi:hypothetical protein